MANARVAYEQAEEQLGRALELVSGLPAGDDRNLQELEVLLKLGPLLMKTRGSSANRTGETFARASALCLNLGETETGHLIAVMYGLWAHQLTRAHHDAARRLADELLALAKQSGRDAYLALAYQAIGVTALFRGELDVAYDHLESALQMPKALHDPEVVSLSPFHPVVGCLTFFASALWLTGDLVRARDRACEAVHFATELLGNHPVSVAHVLAFEASVAMMYRDAAGARGAAKRAQEFAVENGISSYGARAAVVHGWARASQGEAERGVVEIRDALAALEVRGSDMSRTISLALLADAEREAGRPADALGSVDRALALAEKTAERFWEPELHRLRGELLIELSPDRAAEGAGELRTALAIARAQHSESLAARAVESLRRIAPDPGSL